MDVNKHVQEMVELGRVVNATSEDDKALRLADHVAELHHWLMEGGRFPAAWVKHPRENLSRGDGNSGQ